MLRLDHDLLCRNPHRFWIGTTWLVSLIGVVVTVGCEVDRTVGDVGSETAQTDDEGPEDPGDPACDQCRAVTVDLSEAALAAPPEPDGNPEGIPSQDGPVEASVSDLSTAEGRTYLAIERTGMGQPWSGILRVDEQDEFELVHAEIGLNLRVSAVDAAHFQFVFMTPCDGVFGCVPHLQYGDLVAGEGSGGGTVRPRAVRRDDSGAASLVNGNISELVRIDPFEHPDWGSVGVLAVGATNTEKPLAVAYALDGVSGFGFETAYQAFYEGQGSSMTLHGGVAWGDGAVLVGGSTFGNDQRHPFLLPIFGDLQIAWDTSLFEFTDADLQDAAACEDGSFVAFGTSNEDDGPLVLKVSARTHDELLLDDGPFETSLESEGRTVAVAQSPGERIYVLVDRANVDADERWRIREYDCRGRVTRSFSLPGEDVEYRDMEVDMFHRIWLGGAVETGNGKRPYLIRFAPSEAVAR